MFTNIKFELFIHGVDRIAEIFDVFLSFKPKDPLKTLFIVYVDSLQGKGLKCIKKVSVWNRDHILEQLFLITYKYDRDKNLRDSPATKIPPLRDKNSAQSRDGPNVPGFYGQLIQLCPALPGFNLTH